MYVAFESRETLKVMVCALADRNKEAAVAAGAFDPLGRLLTHEVDDVKHQSSMCLDTLLANYKNRLVLKKSEHSTTIIEGCLLLLQNASLVGQENARWGITLSVSAPLQPDQQCTL